MSDQNDPFRGGLAGQKRLILAIALSVAILVVFQFVLPHPPRPAPVPVETAQTTTTAAPAATGESSTAAPATGMVGNAPVAAPREAPRLRIEGPRVSGSLSLLGARLDDLVLANYRETIEPGSPLVRLLQPIGQGKEPSYLQAGWTAEGGVKTPDNTTLWTASAPVLAPGKPVTLHWDNGAGVVFEIGLTLDENYMFGVTQTVRNTTDAAIAVKPWGLVRRDYTPHTDGYSVLHEGLIGWVDQREHDVTYSSAKSDGEKQQGTAFTGTGSGGWAGFTDKYWLAALIPDQTAKTVSSFRYIASGPGVPAGGAYQADTMAAEAIAVAPQATASVSSRAFVGAKEVRLLNKYQDEGNISHLSYAVDWGWFWFITKPFFLAIDWFNGQLGNFGLAILAFTICVKGVFFPLANYSYRSMSKMKLLGPKMAAIKEQYKDDNQKQQMEIMKLYKAEKVNPASGCLPMVIQIPVFFSLYKVIFITIEMRHAPFYGWIQDLSAIDPTNVFNAFGLIPFDPTIITPWLHLGLWPLIMGVTMFFQQKMNPAPPDPVQARLFQFMPIIFTFMLARFPAGLVIYWSWNNTLTIAQQWLIMRQTRLSRPGLART